MGLAKFGLYFALYLLGSIFLIDFIQNRFVTGFIIALILTVLTMKGEN